jgi:NAD(P)-dependent dehydrogenase (short-subunit alcohol dehydrogenase family)
MTKPLTSRIALVTGASRGIGRAIAKALAEDGATVVVHYGGSASAAAETVRQIEADGGAAFAVQADLADKTGVETLFTHLDRELESRFGSRRFDILVNNAGVAPMASIAELDEPTFDRLLQINVKALYLVTKHAAERLRDGGRVINLSSAVTRVGVPGAAAYSATKGFVDSLTLSLAADFGTRNITVNAVAPGVIATDMAEPMLAGGSDWILAKQTFKRVGEPSDVADLVRFLAGPHSRWTTGQTIDVSGGSAIAF